MAAAENPLPAAVLLEASLFREIATHAGSA